MGAKAGASSGEKRRRLLRAGIPAFAGMTMLLASPAPASVDGEAALAAYLQARVADGDGNPALAAQRFAAALALAPDNALLAGRALTQAVAAGNEAVALAAARALERLGKATPEARLLLLGDALKSRRWSVAQAQAAELQRDEVFSFMAPILRAWAVQGSGRGDALALLAPGKGPSLVTAYSAEQRPLLLALAGRRDQAVTALAPLLEQDETERLRVTAAATLAAKGGRGEALKLLDGDGEALIRARAALAAGRRLPGAVDSPAAGAGDFLVKVAADLQSQQVPDLALSFARLATFMAPRSSEAWLLVARIEEGRGRHSSALAALSRVPADDPFAAEAAERRLALLVESGRPEVAIEEARRATRAADEADSWTRLAGLLSDSGRFAEAADAYGRALQRQAEAKTTSDWGLHLLQGTALARAGRWPEAREALRRAYALAPGQPVVLNVLGYFQLEYRENLDEAERLIREADKLRPDDPAITDSLGWAHYVRGDLAKAVELLESAARRQPADAAINEHLGDAYYSAGRRFEARYAWRAALVSAESTVAERLRAKLDAGLKPELAAP
jgi:Flp pilus assembly protein TadD